MRNWRSRWHPLLAAFVLLAASACNPVVPPRNAAVAPEALDPARDCARSGGMWRKGCGLQRYMCFMPYRDSGKVCKDSSECEGRCLFDLVIHCDGQGNCIDPVTPEAGAPATGRCEFEDDHCGSTLEIKGGIAQSVRHHD